MGAKFPPEFVVWLLWSAVVWSSFGFPASFADDVDDDDDDEGPAVVDSDSVWPRHVEDGDRKDYTGHALMRITPQDQYHLRLLAALVDKSDVSGVAFWKEPTMVNENVDILVPPDLKDYLTALMLTNGLRFNIVTDDLQSLVDEERRTRSVEDSSERSDQTSKSFFNLSAYHTYDEIMSYLDYLNSTCNSSCSTQVIGKTYEGRDLKLIKIGKLNEDDSIPGFWIDAGIHAREWISPAAALFLVSRLLDPKDPIGRFLLSRYRFYILPLANPDGYEYTWTHDRLWRKNRSRHPDPRVKCRGVDPNRNWDFHWGERGTSSKPCAENYGGWHPFSEMETQAMANYILSISDSLVVYLSLHSYGQYLLTPWGYTTKLPADFNDLLAMGNLAAEAIRKAHGMQYVVGSTARVLYLASGGSDDWTKGVAGVKYAYTIELRDNGKNGFILPASMINDTGEELLDAIRALGAGIRRQTPPRQRTRTRRIREEMQDKKNT